MMAKNLLKGWRELAHTADWALLVWAPDSAQLFDEAARGMYALMEAAPAAGPGVERQLELEESDLESLLVRFLSELLYLLESERVVFGKMELKLDKNRLSARLGGGPVGEQRKEIKAVTYHDLAITRDEAGLRVKIVFDV